MTQAEERPACDDLLCPHGGSGFALCQRFGIYQMKHLSVVVACVDAARSIECCLSGFERTCQHVDSEIIVVDASQDRTAEIVAARFRGVRLLRCAVGTLAPELWARGYQASQGRVVAFTTGHCVPGVRWARAMLGGMSRGASGAGGPLEIAADATPLDWAVFYLRYSAFMDETMAAGRTAGELAGDNACYQREWLDRFASSFADGFWEIEFHRAVRAGGGWLAVEPEALVAFGPSYPLKTICRHRFAHGRHFGLRGARGGRRRPWQIVGAAPIVPLVLAWRAYARVQRIPGHRRRFLSALPWFLLLASCWAAGEAWGAVAGVAPATSSSPAGDGSVRAETAGSGARRT